MATQHPFPQVDETPPPAAAVESDAQPQQPSSPHQERDDASPSASLLTDAIDETIKRAQQTIQTEEDRFRWLQRLARMFCEAGTFEGWEEKKQNLSPTQRLAQAMVKIMLGESCGMSPIESMQSIYLVKGRPTLDAQIRAARMKRAGYSWVQVQLNEKGCVMIPCHRDQDTFELANKKVVRPFVDAEGKPVLVSFTEADAQRAGLIKEDGGYKKYPADMYFARVITRIQRRFASEVLNGANLLDRYEAEEIVEAREPARPLLRQEVAG